MKNISVLTLSAFYVGFAFAQAVDPDLPLRPKNQSLAVDPDLPLQPKNTNKNPYLLMSDPPTAFSGKYSDLNRIKWLTVPLDSSKPLEQSKCDAISDTYIAHCRKQAETYFEKSAAAVKEAETIAGPRTKRKKLDEANGLKSKAADFCVEHGVALIFRERWDEAISSFEKAMQADPKNQQRVASCLYQIANSRLGKGEKALCIKTLEDLLSRNLKTGGWVGRKRQTNWNFLARQALHYLRDEDLVALNLPRWTDCKVFPEAQKAEYSKSFVKASAVSVGAKGFGANDARIKFLKKKLNSKGVLVAGRGGFELQLVLTSAAKVQKSEGYALKVSSKGAVVEARDMQGILWGIVSFLQVYDYEQKRVRECSIEDWPDCQKRGFLGRCCEDDLEFMLFNKMNINTAKPNFLSGGDYTPINMFKASAMGKAYKDLGIELYYGFAPFTMDNAWPLCWNVFLEMQLENAMKWASCGVGIYYPYDDARYWEPHTKEDQATGKKPSDYDADHLYKFYTRIKAKYPDFKMQFCPPFYWGPNAGHPYPDDRNKYLKSLQKLPEEVSIFWTGERVGSRKKNKPSRDWYSALIGRNPSLFQNKAGPHSYLSYVVDEMPWDTWYYEGFVDKDMRSIQKNSDTPQDFPILSTLADYLWNVKAYDRTRAINRGLNQYAGKNVYEILKEPHRKLCRIDAYRYGSPNSRVLHEDKDEWESTYVEITNATRRVKEIAGSRVMRGFGHWQSAIGWYYGLLRAIRNPPNYRKMYAKPYELLEKHVKETVGCDESKGDIFIDPINFKVAVLQPHPTSKKKHVFPESTMCAAIYSGGTTKFDFNLSSKPKGDLYLYLRGCTAIADKMKVAINGETIYEGKNPVRTKKGVWTVWKTALPAKFLKSGVNSVWVKNASTNGYPIYFEFAVVKNAMDGETSGKQVEKR